MIAQLVILGIVIGSNNFATALALGALGQADKRVRILLVFAIFEFTLPLIGLWLGRRASGLVAEQIAWLGPALIAGLGVWTLLEASRDTRDQERLARWLASWRGLVVLSAGLSLDNLIVGFGLGLGAVPVLVTAGVIMVCSVGFAWIGLRLGAYGRRNYERPAEMLSGLLLLAVAGLDAWGWL